MMNKGLHDIVTIHLQFNATQNQQMQAIQTA